MTSVVVKGKIVRKDLVIYDGIEETASRRDSTGGIIVSIPIGDAVDVIGAYGEKDGYTRATIFRATNAIGSKTRTLVFRPGTWVIDDNLTVGSNFTCLVMAGAVFQVASGKTLTFNGPVIRHAQTWTSGSGTVTESGTRFFSGKLNFSGELDFTSAVIQGGTPLVFEGATDNGFETSFAITDPTADRTITFPDATTTLVGQDTPDDLENKTLTSPTINTPTITSPSISGGTLSGTTTNSGTISGGTVNADTLQEGGVSVPTEVTGTWTPVPSFGGGDKASWVGTFNGWYRRIGGLVVLTFELDITTVGNAASGNDFRLEGLPFDAINNIAPTPVGGNVTWQDLNQSWSNIFPAVTAAGVIRFFGAMAAAVTFTDLTDSDVINGSKLNGQIIYETNDA